MTSTFFSGANDTTLGGIELFRLVGELIGRLSADARLGLCKEGAEVVVRILLGLASTWFGGYDILIVLLKEFTGRCRRSSSVGYSDFGTFRLLTHENSGSRCLRLDKQKSA